MKSILRRGRFTLLALAFLVLVSSATLPVGHTLWSEVLGVSGSVGLSEPAGAASRSAAASTPTVPATATPAGDLLELSLTATGGLDHSSRVYSAYGEVCLTNAGSAATGGLPAVTLAVERQDGGDAYAPLPGATLSLPPGAGLAPGEKRCLPYVLSFEGTAQTGYRVVARLDGPSTDGAQAAAVFVLPDAPAPADGQPQPTQDTSQPAPSATPAALEPEEIVPTATPQPAQPTAAPTQDASLPTLAPTEAPVEQPTVAPPPPPEPTAVPPEPTQVPVEVEPTEPAP